MNYCFNKKLWAGLGVSLACSLVAMDDLPLDDRPVSSAGYTYNYIPDEESPSLEFLQNLRTYEEDDCLLGLISTHSLPEKVDLREYFLPVHPQKPLNACVPWVLVSMVSFLLKRSGSKDILERSALMLYWWARFYKDNTSRDCGCSLADGIRALREVGVCKESLWPYSPTKFRIKPPSDCERDATHCRILDISSTPVNRVVTDFKKLLSKEYPIAAGIHVFESFESELVKKTGVVPMPSLVSENYLGGHAVVFVGYDDDRNAFLVRNSWGSDWGEQGYCWLPYEYLNRDLVINAWKIDSVGDISPRASTAVSTTATTTPKSTQAFTGATVVSSTKHSAIKTDIISAEPVTPKADLEACATQELHVTL